MKIISFRSSLLHRPTLSTTFPSSPNRLLSTSNDELKKTALYELHMKLGGKMVPYAGYSLPVQYATGVKTEHLHTRNSCSLFDVSHMGQVTVTGNNRVQFISKVSLVDFAKLNEYQASLSVFLNEKGGIIDDTVITKEPKKISLVVNGACKEKDLKHLNEKLAYFKSLHKANSDLAIKHHTERALLALQGPKAASVLQSFIDFDLTKLGFMHKLPKQVVISGKSVEVTRCGYTGEDGFEISTSNDDAIAVAEALLGKNEVKPAGLGARDSLRLEAGLCLYGNDIDDKRSIVEAGLMWVLSKERREAVAKTSSSKDIFSDVSDPRFVGYERVLSEIASKPPARRVGIVVDGAPARDGVKVFAENQKDEVGIVTSGTFSPSLNKPLAIGYVDNNIKLGSTVYVQVRNKMVKATLSKMPFVPANYFRG